MIGITSILPHRPFFFFSFFIFCLDLILLPVPQLRSIGFFFFFFGCTSDLSLSVTYNNSCVYSFVNITLHYANRRRNSTFYFILQMEMEKYHINLAAALDFVRQFSFLVIQFVKCVCILYYIIKYRMGGSCLLYVIIRIFAVFTDIFKPPTAP